MMNKDMAVQTASSAGAKALANIDTGLWANLRYKGVALVGLLMLLLVYLGQHIYTHAQQNEITRVDFVAQFINQHEAEVRRYADELLGKSLFALDLAAIKDDIEDFPWVYEAQISRRWPGSLVIRFDEQQPLAIWNGKQLLNRQGEVFSAQPQAQHDNLPQLNNTSDNSAQSNLRMLAQYRELEQQLHAYDLNLRSLTFHSRGTWELQLDNDVVLALGNAPFEQKIDRLGHVYRQELAPLIDKVAHVDLRYPNGVAVKWKDMEQASIDSAYLNGKARR